MTYAQLMAQAVKAREGAYMPYSQFAVGAALLCKDGTVYTGCNIENAAFTPTVCAERVAFFKAVSDGRRDFSAIAVTGGPAGSPSASDTAPCGVCRQVMAEFCVAPDFEIVLGSGPEDYAVHTLAELLPLGFGPKNLHP
ncbi:MAG TPA: cytidine deaminase [Papillibacter sp.]|jgi:cytidine deaminase|nr:cytidine deaminase [Papillibacter sp.]